MQEYISRSKFLHLKVWIGIGDRSAKYLPTPWEKANELSDLHMFHESRELHLFRVCCVRHTVSFRMFVPKVLAERLIIKYLIPWEPSYIRGRIDPIIYDIEIRTMSERIIIVIAIIWSSPHGMILLRGQETAARFLRACLMCTTPLFGTVPKMGGTDPVGLD